MKIKEIVLTGEHLELEQVFEIAHFPKIKISLHQSAIIKINKASEFVNQVITQDKTIYGINTGFGALANKKISIEKLSQLQLNLIRSHCTGLGENFAPEIIRAILLLRVNCLIQGHSGVRPETLELILEFLNRNILPVIPCQGSVGASGDLAPLAHMALAFIGEGEVIYEGKTYHSEKLLNELGIKPLVLGPKEGLALINGTTVMAALGSIAVIKARKLAKTCDIAAALSVDALRGSVKPFDYDISKLKPHPGQLAVSKNLNFLLKDSKILDSHKDCNRVQDPYSLRCIPQVHGACRQTIEHAYQVLSIEINSVTDNPLIFVDQQKVISGGNFHGEALALCMDYLTMGISELSNILERRIEKLVNPNFSHLPAFLTKDSGLNSGLMIAHVTVAALVSENKTKCFPSSVDSIPTSTDKEDHVSMGVTSGRKLLEVLSNLEKCLAIEFLANTQALDLLENTDTSVVLKKVYDQIREVVPTIEEDRVFFKDIHKIIELIQNGSILKLLEKELL
jgi:histidine ammonia-lyase